MPANPDDPAPLAGRVAIVTGIDTDHARAIALALGAAGASVALVGPTSDAVEDAAARIAFDGGRAFGFALRGDDGPAVARLVAHVEQRLGPIDLLVHGGGAGWEALRGAVRPAMVARGRGLLIDASADAAESAADDVAGVVTLALAGAASPLATAERVVALARR